MHHAIPLMIDALIIVLGFTLAAAQGPPSLPEQVVEAVPLGDAQVWVAQTAPAGDREIRVDTFDKNSNRTGYIIIDKQTGRFDRYDALSRHTGTGKIVPPPATGTGTAPSQLRFDEGRR